MGLPPHGDLDVDNRRVFVRVDFNVPLDPRGEVRDDTRIVAALPTLRSLQDRGARLVLGSHLGRPKGRFDPALSLEPVAARLAQALGTEVRLPDEVVGDGARKLVQDTGPSAIVLLENLRFHPGETQNDPKLASALAELCDAYVNDAFGVSHRAHASVVGLPELVRDHAAGELLRAEVHALSRLVEAPEHPFVAVVGGAKVSGKLGVLGALIERLTAGDSVVIGGAMANTFLAARGFDVGGSLHESERFADCRTIETKAKARDVHLLLPTDLVVAEGPQAERGRTVGTDGGGLRSSDMALDIGPQTAERFARIIAGSKMVFWNGPMGLFENAAFAAGTHALARAMADTSAYSVVGGGDSVAAVNELGLQAQIDHVSTGGGASLELVQGRTLPGIAALTR